MIYCILFIFGFVLGYKICKAINLIRDVRNVNFIKITVEKLLSTKKQFENDSLKKVLSDIDCKDLINYKKSLEG